jgi:hypothetical protein
LDDDELDLRNMGGKMQRTSLGQNGMGICHVGSQRVVVLKKKKKKKKGL